MSSSNKIPGLSPQENDLCRVVFSHFPEIQGVILFGSRALGSHRPGSDIDLALQGETISLTTLNRIREKLDDLNLPFTFDLLRIHLVDNTELLDHIQRVGIRLF